MFGLYISSETYHSRLAIRESHEMLSLLWNVISWSRQPLLELKLVQDESEALALGFWTLHPGA